MHFVYDGELYVNCVYGYGYYRLSVYIQHSTNKMPIFFLFQESCNTLTSYNKKNEINLRVLYRTSERKMEIW